MFHRTLLDMPDTFSSFCSTPPQTTPGSLLLIGNRRPSCATPPGGCLAIWLNHLLAQKQARTSYSERCAAKHEHEELNEGIWLEPTLGHAAKRNQGSMDGQAPQCSKETGRGRKLGAEKTFRYWSVEPKQVPRMSQRRRQGEAQALPLPRLRQIPGVPRKREQKARTSKK